MLSAEFTLRLLLQPNDVTAAEVEDLTETLRSSDPQKRYNRLAGLAALALQRPDRVNPRHVEALLEPTDDDNAPSMAFVFEGLAAQWQQPLGPNPATQILNRGGDVACQLELFAILAGWRPKNLTLHQLAQLATQLKGPAEVARFLVTVIERWAWGAPDLSDVEALAEVEAAIGQHPRWPYTRRLLERRQQTASGAPTQRPALGEALPLFPSIGAPRILFVQNLKIGQGDEILRVGPLLSLLLTADPALHVEMVSRRQHLYDHPRIRTTSIEDEESLEDLLTQSFDGFVWLDEIFAPEIRYRNDLPDLLKRRSAAANLVIETTTLHNHLLFRQLKMGGIDLRPDLLPARCAPHDAFESLQLLALRLGLPWLREPRDALGQPFVGRRSPEAESWIAKLQGDASRPLAVVQPFGGHAEIKGYTRGQLDLLAHELEALVDEGYRLVVLPADTSWASTDVIRRVFDRMAPALRRHCEVAMAPVEASADLHERPELEPADRVMRRFKYLLQAADLVVAVEGWACHLAALLNRRVRMVLWAGSFTPDWYPRGVTWCQSLSPNADRQPVDFSPESVEACVLPLPRRGLLEVALSAVSTPDQETVDLLRVLAASPDPDLRAVALRAASPVLEVQELQDIAAKALADPAAAVRSAAAQAWLDREDLRTAKTPPVATLRAHVAIGAEDWPAVQACGVAALPALAIAAKGEASFIRRQARRMLQALLSQRAKTSRPGASDSRPAAS